MITTTLAFLNTPLFNYAAARYVGASLLFVAGPTLAYQQQQMQGTLPSLGQRQLKVLQISLGVAGIFLAWGVPFTTTLPLALTYALFLIVSGMVGMGVALRKDRNWVQINEEIKRIDPDLRTHLGIYPNMGYIAVPRADSFNSDSLGADSLSLYSLPSMDRVNELPTIRYDLLPEDKESMIIHVEGVSNFFIKRPAAVLPERLPKPHQITEEDLRLSQESYTMISDLDLMFLIGKEIQDIDDLGRLIVQKDPNDRQLFEERHKIGAPLWRHLCELHLSYTDEAAHPIDRTITVKKKTA